MMALLKRIYNFLGIILFSLILFFIVFTIFFWAGSANRQIIVDLSRSLNMTPGKFGEMVSSFVNWYVILFFGVSVFYIADGVFRRILIMRKTMVQAKLVYANRMILRGIAGIVIVFLLYWIITLIAKLFIVNITNTIPADLIIQEQQGQVSLPSPTIPAIVSNTQTADMSNWKIYRNDKLGFMFKYPELFKIENEDSNKVSFSGIFEPGHQIIPSQLIVNFKDAVDTQNTKSCDPAKFQENVNVNCIWGNVEVVNINGIEMRRFELNPGSQNRENSSLSYIQTVNDPKIEFIYETVGGGNTFSQIISTFKFLDQTQTSDISNWKTYINEKNGYSIKYPDNLYKDCSYDDVFVLYEGTGPCTAGEPSIAFNVNVEGNINTLQNNNYKKSYNEKCYTVLTRNIEVSGLSAIEYYNIIHDISSPECNSMEVAYARPGVHVEVIKDAKTYILEYIRDANEDIENQILSTFKFTN